MGINSLLQCSYLQLTLWFITATFKLGTSTFEKDATIKQLSAIFGYDGFEGGAFTVDTENLSIFSPVGGKSYIFLNGEGNIDVLPDYESSFCADSECNQIYKYSENYKPSPDENGLVDVDSYRRVSSKKVNEETWMEEISKAYVDYYIPPPDAPFTLIPGFDNGTFVQPFDPTTSKAPECYTLFCATEDNWGVRDPYLGTSPYIEPNGVLTGGFIAGVTIASIVVAVLIFYTIFKRGLENRERRVKEAVLKSIAKTMTLKISKNLQPSDLAQMFQKIDIDGNGNIDKDEMKGLVDEAGVANMSERDYDVLFASIDIDGNGTLDFTEFCAFFASISINETYAEA